MTRKRSIDFLPGLEETRGRFERWRRTRKAGSRIPQSLWNAAVKMAQRHGINPTARALRLDYYTLRKRAEKYVASAVENDGVNTSPFVELVTPDPAGGCECIVELEDTVGAKMRVHFKGVEAPDLAELTRSFRESEP